MDAQPRTVSLTDRIPFEIITEIFRNIPLDWAPAPPYSGPTEGSWEERSENWRENIGSLISATHICHRWRTAALNTADLWTHIDNTVPERMFAFAKRSSSLPVFVAWHSRHFATVKVFNNSLAPRIRRLDIDQSMSGVLEHTHLDLPSLEVLTAIFPPVYPVDYRAPSLKALCAAGCNSPWLFLGHFPHLTHLHVDVSGFVGGYIDNFVRFLSSNPTIEAIYILNLYIGRQPEAPPILLPRLRTLWITTLRPDAAGAFLALFSLPASARVLMRSKLSSGTAAFNFNMPALDALPALWRVSLMACEDGDVLVCADGVAPGGARLQLVYQDYTDGVNCWWARALNLARVETLRLAVTRWDTLAPLVARAQRLRTLALAGVDEDAVAALVGAALPGTLETLSVQGAGLLDVADTDVRRLLARLGPGVSVLLDPECADDERAHGWLSRWSGIPHVTAAVGEGLCRWGPEEAFWEADWAVQTRYFDIPPQEEPGIEFVW